MSVRNSNLFGAGTPEFLQFASDDNGASDLAALRTQVRHRLGRGRRTGSRNPARVVDRVRLPTIDEPAGELWDEVSINGRVLLALAKVTGTGPGLKVDRRQRRGSDGTRHVSKGYEPVKAKITLQIWDRDQLDDIEQFIPEIHPRNRPDLRNAVDIYYPSLAIVGVNKVLITNVGLLTVGSTAGCLEMSIDVEEFRPPTNRDATHRARPTATLADVQTALPPPSDVPGDVRPPSQQSADP